MHSQWSLYHRSPDEILAKMKYDKSGGMRHPTVLYLATWPGDTFTMASGGKEREVRPWKVEKDRLEYLVVGSGHNEALVGILWSAGPNQLVTVSNDKLGYFCQEPGQHQGRDCP